MRHFYFYFAGFNAVSEQEIFPCLRVALTHPQFHSCKVFRTGALIFMGLKSVIHVVESIRYFYPIIQQLNQRDDFRTQTTFGKYQVRNVRQERLEATATSSPSSINVNIDANFNEQIPFGIQEEEDYT